jgi:hypothetical protein
MGIYVFNYKCLEMLLDQNKEWVDFGREIIPAAIDCCPVQAHLFNGYWEDIGTISAFYAANLDLTSRLPKFNLFDADAPIYTRALSSALENPQQRIQRLDYQRRLHHQRFDYAALYYRLAQPHRRILAHRRKRVDGRGVLSIHRG